MTAQDEDDMQIVSFGLAEQVLASSAPLATQGRPWCCMRACNVEPNCSDRGICCCMCVRGSLRMCHYETAMQPIPGEEHSNFWSRTKALFENDTVPCTAPDIQGSFPQRVHPMFVGLAMQSNLEKAAFPIQLSIENLIPVETQSTAMAVGRGLVGEHSFEFRTFKPCQWVAVTVGQGGYPTEIWSQ